jgi:putative addiction module antidote
MATSVKVTQIGSSLGIVLTKDVLAKLRVEKGDQLYISETPDGIHLIPYDPAFAQQMEVARRVMRRNKDVLKKLAK